VRDGQVDQPDQENYQLLSPQQLCTGVICQLKNGDTLVEIDGHEHAALLQPKHAQEVMHQDSVQVRLTNRHENNRQLAVLVKVTKRAITHLAGMYSEDNNGVSWLIPKHPHLRQHIRLQASRVCAKHGEYVMAAVTQYPGRSQHMRARVTAITAASNPRDLAHQVVTAALDLPGEFSLACQEAAKACQAEAINSSAERKDWRHLPFVTIDGADAKDYDDAVYAEHVDDKQCDLYVAIADVSHYVQPGSVLDEEAYERATSIYFPGRVIPMLPEALSNDMCSLLPNVDRYAMGVRMRINQHGKTMGVWIDRVIIRSHARLTYQGVEQMIRSQAPVMEWWQESLDALLRVYESLCIERKRRGALSLDLHETQVRLDDAGEITGVVTARRTMAHQLIEECMLVCNESVAQFLQQQQQPALYRVHTPPAAAAVERIESFSRAVGVPCKLNERSDGKALQKVLDQLRQADHGMAANSLTLMALTQASYEANNRGHYGLAYQAYLHFTSPIRRYPDLIAHRAIGMVLDKADQSVLAENHSLQQAARHCSSRERRADEGARYASNWLKCQYVKPFEGQVFHGRVVSVTHFGLFVQLDELAVDGLVHISQLPSDYYQHDALRMRLVGDKTGQVYQLGTAVTVRIALVNQEEHQIDLSLA